MKKLKFKKRYVLGDGYPWYGDNDDCKRIMKCVIAIEKGWAD